MTWKVEKFKYLTL